MLVVWFTNNCHYEQVQNFIKKYFCVREPMFSLSSITQSQFYFLSISFLSFLPSPSLPLFSFLFPFWGKEIQTGRHPERPSANQRVTREAKAPTLFFSADLVTFSPDRLCLHSRMDLVCNWLLSHRKRAVVMRATEGNKHTDDSNSVLCNTVAIYLDFLAR